MAARLAALAAAAAFAPGDRHRAPASSSRRPTARLAHEDRAPTRQDRAPKRTALAVATDLERIEAERVAALRKAKKTWIAPSARPRPNAQRAQSQPAPIQQGAYNGTTSERDR
jgi:hypothetical protein